MTISDERKNDAATKAAIRAARSAAIEALTNKGYSNLMQAYALTLPVSTILTTQRRHILEGNRAHAEALASTLKTKVVIAVEFDSAEPEHDSRLMLECVRDGVPSYFEEAFNVRYTTTQPEE